ncbi:hypothetical protein HKBW3S42_01065, partial [Candidatus Hakubella thermalkaliphila]
RPFRIIIPVKDGPMNEEGVDLEGLA